MVPVPPIQWVIANKPTSRPSLGDPLSGRRAEYMNFDQGAHNTEGCDDVTRQGFLPLLRSRSHCNLIPPFPPVPLFPTVWVGMTEMKEGQKLRWGGLIDYLSHQLQMTL